jgi:O-antigen/teichoic acid export membrane protein
LHTHSLSSDKYAENTIFFVYAAYLNALLTFGMETAFFRFFTKEKEKGRVISTSFISILFVTILFLGVGFYYSHAISDYFGFAHVLYLQILILVLFFDTLVVIPFAYLRVNNQPVKFAAIKILNICIYAFLNYYFLILLPKSQLAGGTESGFISELYREHSLVVFIFIANLIASLITFLILIPIILKFRFEFDKVLLKKMLAYGLPFSLRVSPLLPMKISIKFYFRNTWEKNKWESMQPVINWVYLWYSLPWHSDLEPSPFSLTRPRTAMPKRPMPAS